jgi:hypothetical protein
MTYDSNPGRYIENSRVCRVAKKKHIEKKNNFYPPKLTKSYSKNIQKISPNHGFLKKSGFADNFQNSIK